jgi:ferredoxin-type protein NapH
MLKITPYLGIIVLIVSIGGLWYPKLGYFLLIVFITLFVIAPFKGRWFCGNLCPRGSFNDFWLSKISLKKRIPSWLRNLWIRIPIFILLMGFMIFRIIKTQGIVDKIGMVFVSMCLVTTIIAIIFGITISPRAWCSFCPMGTAQKLIGKNKYKLECDLKECIKCGICSKVCPMHLPVKEIVHHPDCIKCGRCIVACPKKCLQFKK